jgi:hypothetical protein
MELLLNLIWISLAPLAFFGFLRRRGMSGQLARVPYRKSLLALVCVVVLLFPVISASDDLHPTQVILEEASRRVHLAIAAPHLLSASLPLSMLPAILALYLMFALATFLPCRSLPEVKFALDGVIIPSCGRAPPFSRFN